MAPYSSTLAWKIPWKEEPGKPHSMGSLGVGHDWTTSLSLFIFMHWRWKWKPTSVFLPAESQARGSLVVVYSVIQNRTQVRWLSSSSSIEWCFWSLYLVSKCNKFRRTLNSLICKKPSPNLVFPMSLYSINIYLVTQVKKLRGYPIPCLSCVCAC